ncbi:MAG: hypothetical protein A2147_03015 [Chloroflexi bacterium RBG_16_57_8]|nr:MAG: hypothetical protein A2147_03015 [Chloroflexi bacterium RBG_16_57_8]
MTGSTANKGGKNMFKWVAVAAIGVLVVALVVAIVVLIGRNGELNELNTQLDAAEQQVATLQSQMSGLQSNVSSLQNQLTGAQNQVTSLQANVTSANGQISTLQKDAESKQSNIDAQAAQIKTMKYPRFFSSQVELSNWLQKDNTNTLYTSPNAIEKAVMAFTLQIRAARDGYILPVTLPFGGNLDLLTNRAIVGDVMYDVRAWDDFAQRGLNVSPAMPSYPITPESGQ